MAIFFGFELFIRIIAGDFSEISIYSIKGTAGLFADSNFVGLILVYCIVGLLEKEKKDREYGKIGVSSWFGFSLVIRPGVSLTRDALLGKLNALGLEVRPIVAGNFAKNEVVKYFNSEVSGELTNAEHIDSHGLFVGNHHYSIADAVKELRSIQTMKAV